jgi:hypothetical protein
LMNSELSVPCTIAMIVSLGASAPADWRCFKAEGLYELVTGGAGVDFGMALGCPRGAHVFSLGSIG